MYMTHYVCLVDRYGKFPSATSFISKQSQSANKVFKKWDTEKGLSIVSVDLF